MGGVILKSRNTLTFETEPLPCGMTLLHIEGPPSRGIGLLYAAIPYSAPRYL